MIVFISIITILFLLVLWVYKSTIRLEIIELDASNVNKKHIDKVKIEISILFLNKLKWFHLEINKSKMDKFKGTKFNKWLNKIVETRIVRDYKNIGEIIIKNKQKLDINIEEINIKLKIGTTNVIVTSILFVALHIIISNLLATNIDDYKKEKHNYEIVPIYQNKNFYDLSINCIISVKIAHIINMIKIKRSDKVNARTSNRIFNGNRYEQYKRAS